MQENKVIWITGASSGIGKALSIKFANQGWHVAASARRENLLKELNQQNKNIHPFPLDVTDIEQCKTVFKNIIEKFKDIEICVFGTGIHDPQSEKEFNLEKIRKIMEVNYFGTMNSINSVYNYYKDKKSGQISIVSSVAGYRGLPAAGAYCASKSALTSFAESLHFEMKRKNVSYTKAHPWWRFAEDLNINGARQNIVMLEKKMSDEERYKTKELYKMCMKKTLYNCIKKIDKM